MTWLIARKLLPLIRSNARPFALLVAITSLGIAALVSLASAYATLDTSLDDYLASARYPDGVVSLAPVPASVVDDVMEGVGGAGAWETRLVADVGVRTPARRSATLRVFAEREGAFNELHDLETASNESGLPGLSVERKFAERNDLHAGDTVTLELPSGEQEFFVSHIVASPECINVSRNAYVAFELTDFGYAYADYDTMSSMLGASRDTVNQVSFSVRDGADAEAVLEEVTGDPALSGGVLASYDRADSPVVQAIDASVEPLRVLTYSVPPLLFLAALLLGALFFSQLVRTRRREIGLLMALGFEAWQIACLYAAFALVAALAAGALGTVAGIGLGQAASALYARSLDIPNVLFVCPPSMVMGACAASVLTLLAAAALSVRRVAAIEPSEAMRSHAPASPARCRTSRRARRRGLRLPPLLKACLSSMARNRGRFALGVGCLAVSCGLILLSLTFTTSLNGMLGRTYAERYDFDCQVFLDGEADADQLAGRVLDTGEVGEAEPALLGTVTLASGESTVEALVQGVVPGSHMLRLEGLDGEELPVPEDGIVLAEATARRLGVDVEDTVAVGSERLEVRGISRQNLNFTQYCSLDQAGEILDAPGMANSVLVRSGAPERSLSEALESVPGFSYCSFITTQLDDARSQLESFNAGVVLVIAFAVCIGYAVVHDLSTIALIEREHEFAVLKAIGCSDASIVLGTLAERAIQLVLACAIGLALGNAGGTLLMDAMGSDLVMYSNENALPTFALAAGLTVAFACAAHGMAMRAVRNMDISELVKERD